jgi:hypothetical protein
MVVAGLALAPALATAQHSMAMPSHEFGADLAFMYQSVSSLISGGSSFNHILIGTPVDLRLGFVVSPTLVIEPRIGIAFDSKGTGTSSTFTLAPLDVNALFNLGGGTYRKGMYLTAGAGLNYFSGGGASASQFSFNGGIGTRVPYESGAIRLEAFVRENLKNSSKGIPSSLDIGARVGLSLWH